MGEGGLLKSLLVNGLTVQITNEFMICLSEKISLQLREIFQENQELLIKLQLSMSNQVCI